MSLLNYYNLHTLQTNMVDIDAYEESSSDFSDSISGDTSSFHAEVRVAQNQIYNAENPTRLPYPRKSENHAARSQIHLRNGLRDKNLRKRQSKLREIVILAGKACLKITLLGEKLLHENREVALSSDGLLIPVYFDSLVCSFYFFFLELS